MGGGIGLPFFKGFDPRRRAGKTAPGAEIGAAAPSDPPDKADAAEEPLPDPLFDPEPEEGGSTVHAGKQQDWPRSLSPGDRGLIARAVAETEAPEQLPDPWQLYKLPPYVELDGEGRIIHKKPAAKTEGDGMAFLFMHHWR